MVGALSLCLCRDGFCCPTRLARRSARHVHPFVAEGARRMAEFRGDPRDHDQSLPVFLASEEVEEEKAMGRRMLRQREGATGQEIDNRKLDVGVGTFFSNIVMYFIILTCALTLHAHGMRDIETSKQAAEARKPLARSPICFTPSVLIGVGFLAIPTLTGSSAYAFAETFHWREGLDLPFKSAHYFYGVVILSALLGIGMDFAGINPIKA